MLGLLKKTLGVCLIGFGIGILMVLLLPITGWLFIIRSCTMHYRYSVAGMLIIKESVKSENCC